MHFLHHAVEGVESPQPQLRHPLPVEDKVAPRLHRNESRTVLQGGPLLRLPQHEQLLPLLALVLLPDTGSRR